MEKEKEKAQVTGWVAGKISRLHPWTPPLRITVSFR
jgi:hypothetical protein